MRVFIAGVAFVLCTTTGLAQEPSRWTVSVGPEWTQAGPYAHLWGARLRAEYDLTRPRRLFGVRLEGGARGGATPNHIFEARSGEHTARIPSPCNIANPPLP